MNRPQTSIAVLLALFAVCWLTADIAHATIHDIDIVNFAFTPPNTVVSPGDTVRWTLQAGFHTSTSDIGAPKTWDSGTMSTVGQTFQIVFDEADGFGPFPYHCTIHAATMKDTLFFQPPAVPPLSTTLAESGFDRPVFATSPPEDYQRFFVLEQHTGLIKIYDILGDSTYNTPFLDISSELTGGNEQGLLGLAFHPDYENNGYFYLDYTDTNGDTRVVRYQVSGDPNIADAGSAFDILFIDQPFANHNGGWIAFGPNDGYLYISAGDGGSAGDPNNNGQDSTTTLGTILRLDVDGGSPYAIPGDNPFLLDPGADEVWDYGLRNPWRNSFDRATGDLYIGDVGQGDWEEISFHDAAAAGG
ncbi:MAG: PQQ-dependent sugar dehydrogenase, partial [bacterium]